LRALRPFTTDFFFTLLRLRLAMRGILDRSKNQVERDL